MGGLKMEFEKKKVGEKNFIAHAPEGTDWISADDILTSWRNNSFNLPESRSDTDAGFRSAQLGAIYAIKSHWTVSSSAATVVMPTGTGKTEVMIATVVSECCAKTCVVVPSDLLRKQTIKRFCTLGKLREIGAINEKFENPVVGCLISSPKDIAELQDLLSRSNLVVTTMSLLNSGFFKDEFTRLLASTCDTLIIDEAHHVPANSWKQVKKAFERIRCLQFTATPFRNDGKKIDGDIIYNFPLALAQERGYFKPINFYPIYEFDSDKKDLSVASKAVELLEADIAKGFPHLLLVRASTQGRARALFESVYQKNYAQYSPVLIVSGNSATNNKAALQSVNDGISKIIVCVDMFSEGIDIPQLKVCAIHDKYKSLPITMQFIGRFARTQTDLGEASVVANIVDDDIQESLEDLYSQDADWNKVLKNTSDEKTGREVELQKLARGFTGTEVIPLNQIRPKVSMFMYTTTEKGWHWQRWSRVFNEENSHHFVNEQEKILIITELCTSNVDWTTCQDITDNNWNLHILYWDEKKNVFFINTTDKGIADCLAEAVFDSCKRISGEVVFRCLYGINRLMLSTVGLKTAVSNHHIRYRMFAGVDVAEGIAGATTGTATKSNLFGVGYENGNSISIGCSYKGTIWAKWVETINYWKSWCDKQAEKILNSAIDTSDVLRGALVPEEITARPAVVPYRIDFPPEIETDWKGSITVKTALYDSKSFLMDIGLITFDETTALSFFVGNDSFKEEFTLNITTAGYSVSHKSGSIISIRFSRGREMLLKDFFKESPPTIWFVDGSSLEGNLLVKLKTARPVIFPTACIIPWDWSGVDISKESQGTGRSADSIQYKLISELKASGKYCLIFDDDGSGEVADVIAVQEDATNNKLLFELYHCKYSGAPQAGARVGDLYEVCGQAEKCIKWASDAKFMVERLMKRESDRISIGKPTRYEVGNNKLMFTLKNKLKVYSSTFSVYIVQPGVDSAQITPAMHQVLCSAEAYLKDTYAIPLTLICS
jgi:superfamily II DNA or RNA helicase